MADPAKTPKRTKKETLEAIQAGCKQAPCSTIQGGRIECPFCPWIPKYYLNTEG